MNSAIEKYNASQTEADQTICRLLMDAIDCTLITAESKIWHGSPVWFIDGNPIVISIFSQISHKHLFTLFFF